MEDQQSAEQHKKSNYDLGIPPSRLTLKSDKSTSVPNKFRLKKLDTESENLSDFDQRDDSNSKTRDDANKNTIIEDKYSDRL